MISGVAGQGIEGFRNCQKSEDLLDPVIKSRQLGDPVSMMQYPEIDLILASASSGRAMLLKGAGLNFRKIPADVDEGAVRDALSANDNCPDPADVAEVLARAKAEDVSAKHENALVIGADQVLALGDEIFEKPTSMEQARDNLLRFRGRTHALHAALCLAKGGETIWSHVQTAYMTMRDFSPEFLGHYLAQAGESVYTSVGAYRLESYGVHLFEKIEGDYFTILGLPLLPLLEALRDQDVVGR